MKNQSFLGLILLILIEIITSNIKKTNNFIYQKTSSLSNKDNIKIIYQERYNSSTIDNKKIEIDSDKENKSNENIENSNIEKGVSNFEGLISKLKQTVVMIDINSDMQFFEENSTNSKATGFIVNKELGLIATNKHVTRISPTTHKINFLNGAVEKGTVVYYDFYHDFGFIQLDIAKNKEKYKKSELYKSMIEVELGSSYDLKVNDEIMLIGNNEGVNYSIKYGNVNNVNVGNFNGLGSIILTNFDRTGGSSGSPVWNNKGKVVAIHAMGNKEGSFEVPIDYMKDVLKAFEKRIKNGEKENFFAYDKGFIGAFFSLVPQFKIQNMLKKKRESNLLQVEENLKIEKEEINKFFAQLKNYQRDPEETSELIQVNSIIPSIANKNHLKSGDIIMKVNNQIIGNDMILLEKILNEHIDKKILMKILRFGKIIEIDDVKVFPTEKEKILKFLKVSNTIIHDINLYVKLFNPLIPEGIIISKIGLGSPFNEISNDGQLILSSFNSKRINSINEFVQELKSTKSGNADNLDILDLNNSSFKVYNFIIDFGNIQEVYMYEFDSTEGIWKKKIIKLPVKNNLNNRLVAEREVSNYSSSHLNYNKFLKLETEYNNLFVDY